MHIILTGATGLVGSGVLYHILSLSPAVASAKQITRLSILSRRPTIPLLEDPQCPRANTYTKIEIIPHQDFTKYDEELMTKLRLNSAEGSGGAEERIGLIWALGISQTKVKTEEEYVQITKSFALEAAKAFSSGLQSGASSADQTRDSQAGNKPKQLNFVYVSGAGATFTPGMLTPLFARVKGETEKDLLALMKTTPYSNNLKVYSVRPAGVDDHNQPSTWRKQAEAEEAIALKVIRKVMFPALRSGIWSSQLSPTNELGRVFTELALGDGEKLEGVGVNKPDGRVIENVALRRLYGEMKWTDGEKEAIVR